MTPRRLVLAALLGLLVTGACTDQVPTFDDGSAIPIDAETVEVLLPFSEFGRDFQVFGGFGSQADLAGSYVAHEYRGDFSARTLIRLGAFPASISVFPEGESTTVPDSAYVPLGGNLVIRMDTTRSVPEEAVELEAGHMLAPEWDIRTASWQAAVDTLGRRVDWGEAGGGPVRSLGTGMWDPQEADTLVIPVDSATVNQWREADESVDRSVRVESRSSGHLLGINSMELRARLQSSVNPDTVVTVVRGIVGSTFIYNPEPGVSQEEIRIGGAPARRAFFRIQLPDRFEEGSAACEVLPTCPMDLDRDRVVYAGLVMQTRPVEPPAFEPLDTLRLDVRPTLSPERIPRSPLGSSVQPTARTFPPGIFAADGSTRVEVPMTRYVQDLLGIPDDDPQQRDEVPSTVALLSPVEPSGFQFGSLFGPGTEGEPFLRLILTITDGVQLP